MKKFLFYIAISGLMFLGAKSSALAGNPEDNMRFNAPAANGTVYVTLDWGKVNCPAWCGYIWEIRTYEDDGTNHPILIDTESFNCSAPITGFYVYPDNGYHWIRTEVIVIERF